MAQAQVFTATEIDSFRRGGKILRECLDHVSALVRPGITTEELDAAAEDFIRGHDGAAPAFKGYRGFPATLCTSVNEQCVHGMPGPRKLNEGDIVSIDCGVLIDGLYTDACVTVGVGEISAEAQELLDITQLALKNALKVLRAGVQVGDISHAVESTVRPAGFAPIKILTGHGLGNTLHQFPDIPNWGEPHNGAKLPANTVVAIEPIIARGGDAVIEDGDGWTMVTADRSLSAHFEHSIRITEDGFEILA